MMMMKMMIPNVSLQIQSHVKTRRQPILRTGCRCCHSRATAGYVRIPNQSSWSMIMLLQLQRLLVLVVVVAAVVSNSFQFHSCTILPNYSTGTTTTTTTPSASSSTSTSTTTHRNMFTGIVEDMGTIVEFEQRENVPMWDGSFSNSSSTSTIMTIQTSINDVIISNDTRSAYLGCSISVSGVCLTATHIDCMSQPQQFTVTLAPETLRKTYFGFLPTQQLLGSKVNLERAAEMSTSATTTSGGGRNSGHYVQGHVDGVGTILDRKTDNDSIVYTIQLNDEAAELMSYIVPKGFIAIDGTSLTVIDTNILDCTFTFMLIPYTQQHIILPLKQIGDLVNIEVDILSKYASNSNNNNVGNTNIVISKMEQRLTVLEQKVQTLETELAALKSLKE